MSYTKKSEIADKRKVLMIEPKSANPHDINTWSDKQIALAGAWSKHEIDSQRDPYTLAYDWVPGWTGDLTPMQINTMVRNYYDS